MCCGLGFLLVCNVLTVCAKAEARAEAQFASGGRGGLGRAREADGGDDIDDDDDTDSGDSGRKVAGGGDGRSRVDSLEGKPPASRVARTPPRTRSRTNSGGSVGVGGRRGGDVKKRILFGGADEDGARTGDRIRARVVMNNYFGIGLGAEITLRFHEMRERHPSLFFSRFVNRMWCVRACGASRMICVCFVCALSVRRAGERVK